MLIASYSASPIDFTLLDDLIDEPAPADHDLTYDQRQNGTENIRLNVDGVIIAFPSAASSQASSMVGSAAINYLIPLLAGGDDDSSDDADYFPFVKNANTENGVTAPSPANDKEPAEQVKELSKKKVAFKPEPTKDNHVKQRVVIVKEGAKDESADFVGPVESAVPEEQSKFEVIPIKKVQSRRKNK